MAPTDREGESPGAMPEDPQHDASSDAGDWMEIYADLFADSNQGEPSRDSHDADPPFAFSFRGVSSASGVPEGPIEGRHGETVGESDDLGLLSFLRGGMSQAAHFPTLTEGAPSVTAKGATDPALWMASWGHQHHHSAPQRMHPPHRTLAPLPLTGSIMQGNPPPSLLAAWKRANEARSTT